MYARHRDFIASVILAAVAATAALAQAVPSAVAPGGRAAQRTLSIPDFSGVWAHPYFPGFEPPASGPGPVVNRSRRRDGVGNPNQFVGDYTNAILKPHAADVVKRHGEISPRGASHPAPSNQCWPSGVPYIFFQHGMQVL